MMLFVFVVSLSVTDLAFGSCNVACLEPIPATTPFTPPPNTLNVTIVNQTQP